METHQVETPPQILQTTEPGTPQPPAENTGQNTTGEQEKQVGEASSTPTGTRRGVDESGSTSAESISESELMELEKEDLRILLEVSTELRGEVEVS